MNNNLHENFQSACKVHHSNETVMEKVQDDILHATDSNKAVVLLMLDLSATFDTVSHEIQLDRLSQHKCCLLQGLYKNGSYINNNNNNLNIFMQDCCFSFRKKTAINAGPVKN